MFYHSCQHTSVCRTDEVYSCMIAPVCHFAEHIQQPGRRSPWLHATMFCSDASLVSLFILESNRHTLQLQISESIVGNLWLNVNCWFHSKAWQVVSMGYSRWREQRHIWHITSMMGSMSKEKFQSSWLLHDHLSPYGWNLCSFFPSVSSWVPPLSRKLCPTCSVCSHTSSICPWISICQSPSHCNENVFHYFSDWEHQPCHLLPGCFPTKMFIEWRVNEWDEIITFSVFTPLVFRWGIWFFFLSFWCPSIIPPPFSSGRFAKCLSSHSISALSFLPSFSMAKTASLFLCFLTLY